MTELLGWASSIILVLTLAKQVHKQWHAGTSEGVSKWLFAGQMAASLGFTVYSVLVRNWVFVVTNALMVVNGIVGYTITMTQKKSEG
jgi:MtN3 and saliva related transmembrane protein